MMASVENLDAMAILGPSATPTGTWTRRASCSCDGILCPVSGAAASLALKSSAHTCVSGHWLMFLTRVKRKAKHFLQPFSIKSGKQKTDRERASWFQEI